MPAFQQMGGKTMSEYMWANPFGNASLARGHSYGPLYAAFMQMKAI